MHHSNEIDEANKEKPEIINYYNHTKGGVDSLDQLVHEYMSKKRCNRWPFTYFMNAMDCCGIAAYVVWLNKFPQWNNQKHYKRRIFLQEVAEGLIKPHIERRKLGLQKSTVAAINQFMRTSQQANDNTFEQPPKKKKRCALCPAKKARMQRQTCNTCKEHVCNEHSFRVCVNCNK